MTAKNKPLRVIDTHAGAGGYTLDNAHPKHRAEYLDGIARLWHSTDLPPLLAEYRAQIKALNSGELNYYPGSPKLTQANLRPGDSAWFYEMHTADHRLLEKALGRDRQIHISDNDGFEGLKALLPPPERRALVLMDPSYEIKTDYKRVVDAVTQAHKRFSPVSVALWYPVVNREHIDQMERKLARSGIADIQLYELGISADSKGFGMTASGMVLINPPWTLWQAMEPVLPYLAKALGQNNAGHHRQVRLTAER
ncbi:MAG TPA: 23S rRNA (adenine(2030)-N(6))-methyltransferase RlmJ, partial [Marinobacter sp.]|nr:23S rRNA (adenine(2030)-N(6))-methyltransferase RlmJ [Marinobacter sp.]